MGQNNFLGCLSVPFTIVILATDNASQYSCLMFTLLCLQVTAGYTTDLIELYNYKAWLREPAANAIIELLTTLDDTATVKVTNDVITPRFFLAADDKIDGNDRSQWMQGLNAEQISVALHLQKSAHKISKFAFPLDKVILTADTVSFFAQALTFTSTVVYPRCHIVWNVLWLYLTEENDGHRQLCKVKGSYAEYMSIVKNMINQVVVDRLLGKGETSGSPSNERKSLALQIVSTLMGASNLNIALPPECISSVLSSDIVEMVFLNVLCASGGIGMKRSKAAGSDSGQNIQHHLKSLTSTILSDMVQHCSHVDFNDVDRRLEIVKAFISTDPRFDVRTKTQTVSTLLMMDHNTKDSDEVDSSKEELWGKYISLLEEEILKADTIHNSNMYVELMFKLAKRDLASAPANKARRVIRFFMTAAFFDCSNISTQSMSKPTSSSKKKKGSKKASSKVDDKCLVPPELASAIRIKDILHSQKLDGISSPTRAIMSSRFYSLLTDMISTINSSSRGGNKSKNFYGNASKPESVYRSLSEVTGVASILELSGAKRYTSETSEVPSEGESPSEIARNNMLHVVKLADEALVNECGGSGDAEALHAKSIFTTGCASLMISLYLQLNNAGVDMEDDEDDAEEHHEAVHDFISDLSEIVSDFSGVIENEPSNGSDDDEENPLSGMASLLVNILSSPVGGEDAGQSNISILSASKLTRETTKLAWSVVLSLISNLHSRGSLTKNLVDEDVMNTLIEAVCGSNAVKDDAGDDESMEGSDEEEDPDEVFAKASSMDIDLEEQQSASQQQNDTESEDSDEEDTELDPSRLENMLLEDSDAEMEDVLEHHAGADKALAQLIKMKQDTRKASQSEQERIDLCNRLRCASLLESLFSPSVFKSGLLPLEAVLGSMVPILRSYKSIAKSIEKTSSSTIASKSLHEKQALMDRLATLILEKLSKFRCSSDELDASSESIQKAVSDIAEEMRHSLNLAHCSICSVALITVLRCMPDADSNTELAAVYANAVQDWMSRKSTRIYTCVFDDLIQRLPSLATAVLVEPLIEAVKNAHSGYLKCESLRLLSSFYRGDRGSKDITSKKNQSMLNGSSGKVASILKDSLCDTSMQKTKNKEEVMNAVKHFVSYAKSHSSFIPIADLTGLKEALDSVADATKSTGTKNMCLKVAEEIAEIVKQVAPQSKPPKSATKKKKKSKK